MPARIRPCEAALIVAFTLSLTIAGFVGEDAAAKQEVADLQIPAAAEPILSSIVPPATLAPTLAALPATSALPATLTPPVTPVPPVESVLPVKPPALPTKPASPAHPAIARFFTINQVLAKLDGRAAPAAPVRLAAVDSADRMIDAPPSSPAPKRSEEPFGLYMFRAPESQPWVKWRGVEAEMREEAKMLAQCQSEPEACSSPAALRFLAVVAAAAELKGRARLEEANRRVNAAIRYVSDLVQHGVLDLWSAPLATLSSGRGDCEDYAIAKYAALRAAGVKPEDLRIVLLRDRARREDHAVLAARAEGRWYILDNRRFSFYEDQDAPQYLPLYAIDHEGVKLLAAPYAMRPMREIAPAAAQTDASGASGRNEAPLLM